VPQHVMRSKNPRLLTITYREGEKGSGMLTFRAPASAVAVVRSKIEQQLHNPGPAAVRAGQTAAKSATGEDWWGDSYWRTNRNHSKWPSGDAEVQAGTK
jgi:hypothetical protein